MFERQEWFPYFCSGIAAVVASWILSGCYIGNKIESQPNPDPISGYYDSAPQTLTFCANISNRPTPTVCKDAPPTQVPAMIGAVMTAPVIFLNKSTFVGFASATDPANANLPSSIDPGSLAISFTGSASPVPAWNDPACVTQLSVDELGSINLYPSPAIESVGGSSVAINGRITVEFSVINTFAPATGPGGNCAPSMANLAACFTNPNPSDASNPCGGSTSAQNAQLQAELQAELTPYINAGVMSAADLPFLTSLAYDVSYK